MAVKYFFDTADGETIELGAIYGMDNAEFAKRFPDIKGKRCDSFSRYVGFPVPVSRGQAELPVMRTINYRDRPSRHQCDARCIHAKGRTMNCECSCGGKNHGKGA